VIHAVESLHSGTGPSEVMYISSVPLTANNADYVRDQRGCFLARRPPPKARGEMEISWIRRQGVRESPFRSDLSGFDVAMPGWLRSHLL